MKAIRLLLERVEYVVRNEGWIAFIRAVFIFIRYHLIFRRSYYLSECRLMETKIEEVLPLIDAYSLKIIDQNHQVDELALEGLKFSPWYPIHRERLNKGAIAFCVFVGKELAHISWCAFEQDAMKSLGGPPLKVDFAHNESVCGAYWTSPKYRGYRLAPYATRKKYQYIRELGTVIERATMAVDNVAARRAFSRGHHRIYATGRHLRILWWESWKEMLLDQSEDPIKRTLHE